MSLPDPKALQILGGRPLLEANLKAALRKLSKLQKRGGARVQEGDRLTGKSGLEGKSVPERAKVFLSREADPHLEPGELGWTGLIRSGLPAKSTQTLAGTLRMSVSELAESLRLPARTVHRRLAKREVLTPEESERNVRAARVLAKAQELLGDENGRGWVLSPCGGLGGEVPITLLDTADGFTAVMDELGRLEYGVLS